MPARRAAAAAVVAAVALAAGVALADLPTLELDGRDRLLVLAPHPDDETIGAGGIIHEAVRRGIPVRVVFLTYGDANERAFMDYSGHPVVVPSAVRAMAAIRHDEAVRAAAQLGLPASTLGFLGFPDLGIVPILRSHWDDRPYESVLTRVTRVPYPTALHPGTPYTGDALLATLRDVVRTARPTKILTSHPGDAHPDHQGLHLLTRLVAWEVAPRAAILPYLVHHHGWPGPGGPADELRPPTQRPAEPWARFPLPPGARRAKAAALAEHATQMAYAGDALREFVRASELFGGVDEEAVRGRERTTDAATGRLLGRDATRIRLSRDALLVATTLSRPVASALRHTVELWGVRRDRPFADMPKLVVDLGPLRHTVRDRGRRLPPNVVRVERRPRRIIVSIPLAHVGNPDRAFLGRMIRLAGLPVERPPWRVLLFHDT